jgi:hypothetical protein
MVIGYRFQETVSVPVHDGLFDNDYRQTSYWVDGITFVNRGGDDIDTREGPWIPEGKMNVVPWEFTEDTVVKIKAYHECSVKYNAALKDVNKLLVEDLKPEVTLRSIDDCTIHLAELFRQKADGTFVDDDITKVTNIIKRMAEESAAFKRRQAERQKPAECPVQ